MVLTCARHNQMQSAEHPALCKCGRAEDSESQHPMHVSAITNELFFPFGSHSPIKTHTHTPRSGLVQYIFSLPARLAYVSSLLTPIVAAPPS